MVEIKCKTDATITLAKVTPFQGDLKKRSQADIDELKASLKREGLLMPFAVWRHGDTNYLLDGHGRLEALKQLSAESEVPVDPEFGYPCIFIDAETDVEARKALLQITSSYGKITKAGAKQFMLTIPDYVAPSVAKFTAKPVTKKPVEVKDSLPKVKQCILKIRVPAEKKDELLNIFSTVNYIEVL